MYGRWLNGKRLRRTRREGPKEGEDKRTYQRSPNWKKSWFYIMNEAKVMRRKKDNENTNEGVAGNTCNEGTTLNMVVDPKANDNREPHRNDNGRVEIDGVQVDEMEPIC